MADELATLLSQVGQGNQHAFRQLYEQTSPRLYAIALRILRHKDDAEEVLQDVFVNLWQAARQYDAQRGSVHTWLSSIIRHKAIDRLRRDDTTTQHLDDEQWQNLTAPDHSPLQHMLEDRDSQALARCLAHLEHKQYESLALAYFHGLSHSQLAQQLNAPLGSVKAWVRRGLARLKECMQP